MTNPEKKKFRETRVGKFLIGDKGLLGSIGDVIPDSGVLGVVKRLIINDKQLSQEDKDLALKMLEIDHKEMQEVSNRWNYDMGSDSWLSKNTRPLTLIYLTTITTAYIVLDSMNIAFDIEESWVELLKTLLVTIYVAYFGSRGFEKYANIKK